MCKKGSLIIILAVLALALVISGAAPAQPSPAATLPLAAQPDDSWASGWVTINQGQTLTFNHNLGGDPGLYSVELWFCDVCSGSSTNIHNIAYGGLQRGSAREGAYWSNLTESSIQVTRNNADDYAHQVRLRLWQPDPPDYDSGWVNITAGQPLLLTHNLGGDANDYVVGIKFRNSTGGMGIHHYAFGGMYTGGALVGGAWQNLTNTTIQALRFGGDNSMDSVRVTIFRPEDAPLYDSGWRVAQAGQPTVFNHAVGGNPLLYMIRLSAQSTQNGINTLASGGLIVPNQQNPSNPLSVGVSWRELSNQTLVVNRWANDPYAPQVRLRIYVPQFPMYLPVLTRRVSY